MYLTVSKSGGYKATLGNVVGGEHKGFTTCKVNVNQSVRKYF